MVDCFCRTGRTIPMVGYVLAAISFAVGADAAVSQGWTQPDGIEDGVVAVEAVALSPVAGIFGESASGTLEVRCEDNLTRVSLSFEGTFLSDVGDYSLVTLRLDDTAPYATRLEKGDDHSTLRWPVGRESITFLTKAMPANELGVTLTAFTDDRLETTFSLAGLSEAIAPVRAACRW
ncbi:type VI secretion system (T6SS) VasI/EvfG family protein [Aliiruegeria haliotis]|uniref:Type VI secretion system (T6SS) VasI/EvfG family protein n=1 Tax=Aliiruegeria haliotis TaxID=1280846 RepID=A0A2T0S072_9RHOB|nr:type VI secretion system-associated protein TagO [Aliiruegeria haliotis]PRY26829.1 type VI secretion system (T6SS) VasI/EvfG family protein [Aliiruegeria haliotis]